MIKTLGKVTLAGLLAAVVLGVPVRATAQDSKEKTPAAPAAPGGEKTKGGRIMGKLTEIDKTAKTFTVSEQSGVKHTFQVTSDTKFYKNDNGERKPSTFEEGVVGQDVTGSTIKGDDGKVTARNVYWGGGMGGKKKKKEGSDTPAQAPKQ